MVLNDLEFTGLGAQQSWNRGARQFKLHPLPTPPPQKNTHIFHNKDNTTSKNQHTLLQIQGDVNIVTLIVHEARGEGRRTHTDHHGALSLQVKPSLPCYPLRACRRGDKTGRTLTPWSNHLYSFVAPWSCHTAFVLEAFWSCQPSPPVSLARSSPARNDPDDWSLKCSLLHPARKRNKVK